MTKYGKEIQLTETEENNFRVTRISVSDCTTPKEADAEIRKWLKETPELQKIKGNKTIIDNSLIK